VERLGRDAPKVSSTPQSGKDPMLDSFLIESIREKAIGRFLFS